MSVDAKTYDYLIPANFLGIRCDLCLFDGIGDSAGDGPLVIEPMYRDVRDGIIVCEECAEHGDHMEPKRTPFGFPKPDVLCVPASNVADLVDYLGDLDGMTTTNGIRAFERAAFDILLDGASFVPRDKAEGDISLKQVIPYVVITSGDMVFRYTRAKGGGEGRLHDLLSIGIGGHAERIDIGDADGEVSMRQVVEEAMVREFFEEVAIRAIPEFSLQGFINHDGDDVGRVHVGVLYECDLSRPAATAIDEDSLVAGGFVTWAELMDEFDRLEPWSRIAARYMAPPLSVVKKEADLEDSGR